eukprot:TRINITY_DN1958_c1_g1_i1.p1 TRINITY_DN1958_c1_g1~~TRINITY_DN1958_c1_g1_i1.p1  ORF type:complete len:1120 (+),score=295.64 TRINITY_DN1958_c1_g1_i1:51-3362(+)
MDAGEPAPAPGGKGVSFVPMEDSKKVLFSSLQGRLQGALSQAAKNSPRNLISGLENQLGKLAGDGGIVGGGPIRDVVAQPKKMGKEPVAGYIIDASYVHGFLRQIATLAVESPRQIEVYLYIFALLCFTVQIMLTVSVSRSTPMYNMNMAVKDALLHEEFKQDHILRFRKSFTWIGEEEEVWQWLLGPVVNTFWGPGNDTQRWPDTDPPTDGPSTTYIRTYNQPVLALLLRTYRVEAQDCSKVGAIPSDLSAVLYRDPCAPQYSPGRLTGESFGPDKRWLSDAEKDRLRASGNSVAWSGASGSRALSYTTKTFPALNSVRARHYTYESTDKSFTVPLFVEHQSGDDVRAEIASLRDNGFIDSQTRLIMAEAVLFNRNLRTWTDVKMWVEMDAGGHMVPDARFRPFVLYSLDTTRLIAMFVLDIVVVCYYGYECFALLKRLWHIWIIRRDWTYMVTFWNLVTATQIVLILYGYTVKFTAYRLSSELDEEDWGLANLSTDIGQKWERLVEYAGVYTEALDMHSLNACILWCRLLAFFQHLPRLSSLTDTVYRAAGELVSVLLIAFVVCMGYSLMATTLWGYDIAQYSSWGKTLMMLFRVGLDIGYFEYEEMYFLHPWLTVFFFCTFVFFMFVLIVNMLLAVITEAFVRAAHAKRTGGTGVSTQVLIKALVHRGRRVVTQTWAALWDTNKRLMLQAQRKQREEKEQEDKSSEDSEDEDDLNIMGMDPDTQLLMKFRDTVRTAKHLHKLSAAINSLHNWMDQDGNFISVEELQEICPVGKKSDEKVFIFNRRQWRVIEDLFRAHGKVPMDPDGVMDSSRNQRAPPRWKPLGEQGSDDAWGGETSGQQGAALPWMMTEAQEQIALVGRLVKRSADDQARTVQRLEKRMDMMMSHLGIDYESVAISFDSHDPHNPHMQSILSRRRRSAAAPHDHDEMRLAAGLASHRARRRPSRQPVPDSPEEHGTEPAQAHEPPLPLSILKLDTGLQTKPARVDSRALTDPSAPSEAGNTDGDRNGLADSVVSPSATTATPRRGSRQEAKTLPSRGRGVVRPPHLDRATDPERPVPPARRPPILERRQQLRQKEATPGEAPPADDPENGHVALGVTEF